MEELHLLHPLHQWKKGNGFIYAWGVSVFVCAKSFSGTNENPTDTGKVKKANHK